MKVLVCGAGGVARALVSGLLAAGHQVEERARAGGLLADHDAAVLVPAGTAAPLPGPAPAGLRHLVLIDVAPVVPAVRRRPDAERALADLGVPWSLQRATVVHQVLDGWLQAASRRRVALVPAGLRHQPVDAAEVCRRVLAIVKAGPVGRVPDVGGPEVRRIGDLAADWSTARGAHVRLLPAPPGVSGQTHLAPDRALPGVTWAEYLRGGNGAPAEGAPTPPGSGR